MEFEFKNQDSLIIESMNLTNLSQVAKFCEHFHPVGFHLALFFAIFC